ncbi:MAG: hypothetical protein RR162_07550, partial [Oscillospiraceae bacterium]
MYFNGLPTESSYAGFFVIVVISGVLVDALTENLSGFFTRSNYAEITCIIKWWCFVLLSVFFYLFVTKTTAIYSRVFFMLFILIGSFLMCFLRMYFKRVFMKHYRKSDNGTKIALVTTLDKLADITTAILAQKNRDYYVSNIILVDGDYCGESVNGFDVTANFSNMFDVLCSEVLDEVFINVGQEYPELNSLVSSFQSMGATVHLSLDNLQIPLPNARTEVFIG